MHVVNPVSFPRLPNKQAKLIRSLRLKKYRQHEQAFLVEGAKNIQLLLNSHYAVQMIVGTSAFLDTHNSLKQHGAAVFQADEATLASLGTFTTNKTVLAVAKIPSTHTSSAPSRETWGLVLDDIRDPGNLGTILRIAAWYNIPALICSPRTVDLYNPKVLHASMGNFVYVQVYYTPLKAFLSNTSWSILGASTKGHSIYHTHLPLPGLMVIGNESQGISQTLLPYIQRHISIPRYGQAESLNAAMATAIVCDHWRRPQPTENFTAP
ncbi:MAG: TrmH family RNA methyltransferase [Bacteroidota bacterium]